jgi:asparagine synthase (glutamine-hydrolysing)
MKDWHGLDRGYRRTSDGRRAIRLKDLAQRPLQLDPIGVRAAWGMVRAPRRTALAGILRAPPPPRRQRRAGPWSGAFEQDVAGIAARAEAPLLALGGGVDAAAVLCAWRNSGKPLPAVVTLETGWSDYDEVDAAQAVARHLGARCERARVSPADLLRALPHAVGAAEAPLYNLHPVSRWALAQWAWARGFRTLITGDGADAAFRGAPDLDYVPIVWAMTRDTGMQLESPFLESPTLASTLSRRDPSKSRLRDYLEACGLPAKWTRRPKRPRWMPALDLSSHLRVRRLEAASRQAGLPLDLSTDRARTGWVTLSLLMSSLEPRA